MKRFVRLAVAMVILGYLIWHGNGIAAHWSVVADIPATSVLAALVVLTLNRLLMAYKWTRLLYCRGSVLPLLRSVQIYCSSMVWGLFLPATLGADAVRTICTRREGIGGHEIVASILIERGIGFITSTLMAVLSVIYLAQLAVLGGTLTVVGWISAALLLGLVLMLWASFTQTVYTLLYRRALSRFADTKPVRLIRQLHDAYRGYSTHRGELVLFFVLSLCEILLMVPAFWFIALGLGADASPAIIAAAVFLSYLVARIPVSLGGIGVFEAMFVLVLSLVGIPSFVSLTIALVLRVLEILSWMPWWLSYTLNLGSFAAPRSRGAT